MIRALSQPTRPAAAGAGVAATGEDELVGDDLFGMLCDAARRRQNRCRPEDRQVVELSAWDLLCWTYHTQRAPARPWTPAHWTEILVQMDEPGQLRTHVDVVLIHAAVCRLPFAQREAIWSTAPMAMEPEPCLSPPQPLPQRREGKGGSAILVRRHWELCPPITLRLAERRALDGQPDRHHRILDRYEDRTVGGERQRAHWRYRIMQPDPQARPPGRQRPDLIARDAATGAVRSMPAGPVTEVEAQWCPVEWTPSVAFVAAANAIHSAWRIAVTGGYPALSALPLQAHRVIGHGAGEAVGVATGCSRRERRIIDAAWTLARDGAEMAGRKG